MLSDAEAKRMDKAIKQVAKHYPINVSQKQLDIGFAIYAAAEIYGPRIAATIVARRNGVSTETNEEQPSAMMFNFPNVSA